MADDKEKKPESTSSLPEHPGTMQLLRVDAAMAQKLGCNGLQGLKQIIYSSGISTKLDKSMGGLCIRGADYERLLAAQHTKDYRLGDKLPEDPNRKKPSHRVV